MKTKNCPKCDGTLYQTNNEEIRKVYALTCGKCNELFSSEELGCDC